MTICILIRGVFKGGQCRGSRRMECNWNFTDVCRVVNVLSLPPLGSSRDFCLVERLCPHFLAVVPVELRQTDLGLLHPKIIGCLLQKLRHFFGRSASLLGLPKLFLQVRDLLLSLGQLYFSIVELLALLLSLVLSVLKAGLNAPSFPLFHRQLHEQLLVLLLRCIQGLVGLGAKVSLDPGFVTGVFHPLLSHEYLMDGLRKNNQGILC